MEKLIYPFKEQVKVRVLNDVCDKWNKEIIVSRNEIGKINSDYKLK
jgi:hypothetical protein